MDYCLIGITYNNNGVKEVCRAIYNSREDMFRNTVAIRKTENGEPYCLLMKTYDGQLFYARFCTQKHDHKAYPDFSFEEFQRYASPKLA